MVEGLIRRQNDNEYLPDAAGSVHIMHVPAGNPDEHNNVFT